MHFKHRCFGIVIRKTERRIAQLWVCFSGVEPHTHPGQSFEVIPIFGKATFHRQDSRMPPLLETATIDASQHLRAFTVPAGWLHWFTTRFLVVLTISDKPVPATKNYHVE